ncbi:MAG TPA: sigma-70 family RNA polymerase sigma factor [Tepidisphaeraceae bacterium]|jgi:RNA polymerase sigma-70 factor (ECF subfamily)
MDNTRTNILKATDEQLLAAYLGGDRGAFADLVRRHEQELYRFLRRFTGDAAAAEDVFQEAFLQVHQSARSFDPSKSFRPWLFTIAANKARDLLRSRARRRTVSTDAPMDREGVTTLLSSMPCLDAGPADRAQTAEIERRVTAVVEGLPATHREVLLLAYFHQFPYRQIGQVLNLPLGTVKSRLHVAVRAFSTAWNKANKPSEFERN